MLHNYVYVGVLQQSQNIPKDPAIHRITINAR